jgi:hypothetical protein
MSVAPLTPAGPCSSALRWLFGDGPYVDDIELTVQMIRPPMRVR